MSNMQTKLHGFRAAWATKPERSFWPADLEPLPDLLEAQDLPPLPASFFLNADDTPRYCRPSQAWPEPVAAVVHRPLPAFRDDAGYEEQTRAA